MGVSVYICRGCDEVSCVVSATLEEFSGVDFFAVDCRSGVSFFRVANFMLRDVVFFIPIVGVSDSCRRCVLVCTNREVGFSWDEFFDGCVFWVEVGCVTVHEGCYCCK